MTTRVRKLGPLGQSAFQTLCHQAGLTANPAIDDHEGWDFLVEWPAPASSLPADRSPRALSAFVQVKATSDSRRHSCQVKLSNALRFAKNPTPCFTVLFIFADDDLLPSKTFVSHFWDADIEQALAAGRSVSVNGKPLHRESFTIRFDPGDAVPLDQLLERIRAAVVGQGPHYDAAKQKRIDSAGADGLSFKINVTFDDGVTRDQLLNAMLGDGEPLQASAVQVLESRFGVTAPRDDWSGPAALKIEPTIKTMDLVITRPGAQDVLRLPGKATFAQMPGPSGLMRRLRVQADYLTLNLDLAGEGHLSLTFDGQAAYTIAQLRGIVRLSAWVSNGPVDLSLDTELGALLHGRCEMELDRGKPFWRLMDEVLGELIDLFPLDGWPPTATFVTADLAEGWRTISQFSATLTQAEAVWAFEDLDPSLSHDALRSVSAVQGVQYLDLGTATLFAIYVASLQRIEITDGNAELTLGAPDIRYRQVLRGDARTNWTFMRGQVAKVQAALPPGLIHSDLPDDLPAEEVITAAEVD